MVMSCRTGLLDITSYVIGVLPKSASRAGQGQAPNGLKEVEALPSQSRSLSTIGHADIDFFSHAHSSLQQVTVHRHRSLQLWIKTKQSNWVTGKLMVLRCTCMEVDWILYEVNYCIGSWC